MNDDIDPELAKLIEAAEMERFVRPTETDHDRAKRILDEAAPVAAMSIVQLSRLASNENLRYRASVYILDRVLGVAKDAHGTDKASWEKMLEGVTVPDDVSSLE